MKLPFFCHKAPADKAAESAPTEAERSQQALQQTTLSEGEAPTSGRCEQAAPDLRHPNPQQGSTPTTNLGTVSAAESQPANINMAYHYDDADILSLLTHALKAPIAAGQVTVGAPAENLDRVYEGLTLWHEQCRAPTGQHDPAIFVQPYSPELMDGMPCNHWSVLILTRQGASGPVQVAYIDPLEDESSVPESLHGLLAHAFGPAQTVSHKIKHTAQQDAASCGPRIVEDAIELAQHVCQHKHLPAQLTNAEARDARAIRAQHLAALGGPQSAFGLKQDRWQPGDQPITKAAASAQSTFRGALLALLPQLSEKEHQAMLAEPSLETLEQLGVTVPPEYAPHRPWANRFLADYGQIVTAQKTFLNALEACENVYPGLFNTLQETWSSTQEGFPVLKVMRGDMKGLIEAQDKRAWESPEAQLLTQLSQTFFKHFKLTQKTTSEQLSAAEFADMELIEWAFEAALTSPTPPPTPPTSDRSMSSGAADAGSDHSHRSRSPDSFDDLYGIYG